MLRRRRRRRKERGEEVPYILAEVEELEENDLGLYV